MKPYRTILLLSLPLTALVVTVSCIGLFTPGFYSGESLNWQAQCIGQDMVDLFLIAPCLLITSVMASRKNRTASMIWAGVVLYLTYTFVLYCFDVHFNKLFILYCLCLGLSFYSCLYFSFMNHESYKEQLGKNPATRFIAVYFIIIAVLFYFLWLSEIIPSLSQNAVPKSVTDAGLFTNGVHVLDLSVILPAIFITGVLLLKGKSFGFILTPVILTFFVLMDITIGILVVVMKARGVEGDLMLTVIMSVLALFSLSLLIWYMKSMKTVSAE